MTYGRWKELYKAIQKRERNKIRDIAIANRIAQYQADDWEKTLSNYN